MEEEISLEWVEQYTHLFMEAFFMCSFTNERAIDSSPAGRSSWWYFQISEPQSADGRHA